MTTPNRHTRTHDRTARRQALLDLLTRINRLTPTETALLVEHTHTELAAADALRSTLIGVERALQRKTLRLEAAETAIAEAERDRDEQTDQHRRLVIELHHWQNAIVPRLIAERDQARNTANEHHPKEQA